MRLIWTPRLFILWARAEWNAIIPRRHLRDTHAMKIAIVCRESRGAVDAIRDHSRVLAAELRQNGDVVDLHMLSRDGAWVVDPPFGKFTRRLSVGLDGYDLVLVQYNPFLYGRRGFAPWLAAELWRLRRHRSRPRIALIVHEPFVPMIGWRWMLMGLWQRVQLAAILAASDLVLVSIEVWTERLSRWTPRRPTRHLPVGSNFPDRADAREDERRSLGVGPGDFIVAFVDTGGGARLPEFVSSAVTRLATRFTNLYVLVLGAHAVQPPGIPANVQVRLLGEMTADRFAASLSAADVFLAPYIDGVSTRRGSLMAALQHGVPVLGTVGPLTDSVLREAHDALRLVPVGEPDSFADMAECLALDAGERHRLGDEGRSLYRSCFDWPVIARELLAAVRGTSETS